MKIKFNSTSEEDIYEYLIGMNQVFIPHLDESVDITAYSKKVFEYAFRVECFMESKLVGLLGCYMNENEGFSYITSISVIPEYQGKGIAQILLETIINECSANEQIKELRLEVHNLNKKALQFYIKNKFIKTETRESSQILSLQIN